MDTAQLAVIIALLAIVALVGFVVVGARRRRSAEAPLPPSPGVDYAPGVGDDAGEPLDTPRRGVETIDLPDVSPTVAGGPPAAPEVERPESAEGRMVRLRARLARSGSVLGLGLLSLLSRDSIDEDTWEEIEDMLLSADLGVAATTDLVERSAHPGEGRGLAHP